MEINTSIPLWGVIAFALPTVTAGLATLIRMWYKQQDQEKRITEHQTEIEKQENGLKEIRDLISKKNQQVFQEVKKLDGKFQQQGNSLIEIKTMLSLLMSNKIKHDDN
ncbi:hypothetical protein DN752_17785 [Echinicola strongylocentroti]|uniref:Uncharacterized protein n=1 Tax=Echinicola strongylocentroti TaxID=1795355 RepID=A0A2Z4IL48_9BACT|nr:hypothetical protein [Echinicola strongylocentroti]AWW31832.1 hypothetical protein DN752_17785 [Echinicola strongylocentroti]